MTVTEFLFLEKKPLATSSLPPTPTQIPLLTRGTTSGSPAPGTLDAVLVLTPPCLSNHPPRPLALESQSWLELGLEVAPPQAVWGGGLPLPQKDRRVARSVQTPDQLLGLVPPQGRKRPNPYTGGCPPSLGACEGLAFVKLFRG